MSSSRLTLHQLNTLTLIYRFRFVTSKHVQTHTGQANIQQTRRTLKLLESKHYIGKHYNHSDSSHHRLASYYLLPDGRRTLKQYRPAVESRALHRIYKDKTAKRRFQNHCLKISEVSTELTHLYGNSLEFFTPSELVAYTYFPSSRLDGYIRFTGPTNQNQYLLFMLDSTNPFFVIELMHTIRYLANYIDAKTWEKATKQPLPTILLVCDTSVIQRYVLKSVQETLRRQYIASVTYIVTTTEHLAENITPHDTP